MPPENWNVKEENWTMRRWAEEKVSFAAQFAVWHGCSIALSTQGHTPNSNGAPSAKCPVKVCLTVQLEQPTCNHAPCIAAIQPTGCHRAGLEVLRPSSKSRQAASARRC
jgi:hypothetical protein